MDTEHGKAFTINLDCAQAEALGIEADELVFLFEESLKGIAALRRGGPPTPEEVRDPRDYYGDSYITEDCENLAVKAQALIECLTGVVDAASRKVLALDRRRKRPLAQALGRDQIRLAGHPSPRERWATGEPAEDADRLPVPETARKWGTDAVWYMPPDGTPRELRGGQVETCPWAIHRQTDPTDLFWGFEEFAPVIPHDIDAHGWPLNPAGRTGLKGRNLPMWGENLTVDMLVTVGEGRDRKAVLIKRRDCGKWSLPGGMVDKLDGSTVEAALREAGEECGEALRAALEAAGDPAVLAIALVDDPRVTDNAWITTTLLHWHLESSPALQGGDDAVDARWFEASSPDALFADLARAGERIYEPHVPLISRALLMDY